MPLPEQRQVSQCIWSDGKASLPTTGDVGVTVCIPCYHSDLTLPETLESLLSQSHTNWELIVVEDGAASHTQEIVTTFAARTTNPIRCIQHPQNRGLSAARNTAITAAKYDLIALLDSDDWWTPDHLENLLRTWKLSSADIVFTQTLLTDEKTRKTIGTRRCTAKQASGWAAALYTTTLIQPSSIMLTRNIWKATGGFDESIRMCEDADFWLRIAKTGATFAYSDKATCLYRVRKDSMSSDLRAVSEARLSILRQHTDLPGLPETARRAGIVRALKSLAYRIRAKAPAQACGLYREAWKLQPHKLHHFIFAVVCRIRAKRVHTNVR